MVMCWKTISALAITSNTLEPVQMTSLAKILKMVGTALKTIPIDIMINIGSAHQTTCD